MDRLISFLIHTNIIVSLAAFCLYKVTEILFNISDFYIGCFVFFSTLCAYNYMSSSLYLNIDKDFSFRVSSNKSIGTHLITLLSAIIVIYLIVLLGFVFLKLVLPLLVIGILYPLYIKINGVNYNIRSIPLFKIFLISLCWTHLTLGVPLLYHNYGIDYFFIDSLFQRFLFIVAISIPFDIRDIYIDNITTLPKSLGIWSSKLFAWFCLFIIDVLLIIDLINGVISLSIFLGLFLTIELTSIIIWISKPNNPKVFYGIMVEGLSIIMCLFVYTFNYFL